MWFNLQKHIVPCEDNSMSDTLSKADIKRIRSLKLKKNRDELGWFIAEGEKLIQQFLASGLIPVHLVGIGQNSKLPDVKLADPKVFKELSQLDHPSGLLAVFKKPTFNQVAAEQRVSFFLEDIQDPGNFGSILRTASWFGIEKIFCSPFSVDRFNSKVVQSSMGSLALVEVEEISVEELILVWKSENRRPYYADMNGSSFKEVDSHSEKIGIILGNEGNGISEKVKAEVQNAISIPAAAHSKMESLNVCIATSILMSHFY